MSSKVKIVSPTIQQPDTFIQYCFYTLFFITPLLLWPFTSEVFEFNKMMFVYAMTSIIISVWAFRTFKQQKFEIARTPLDVPILLFLASQVISTILSIDRHTSLWGYYSRFHGGLMSTICYTILFYALVTFFTGQKKAIHHLLQSILATAALTSVYAILEKMGIDKHIWVQDVQNRVFSTLGQPNWLSAYLIAIVPLSLYSAVKTPKTTSKIIYVSLTLLYLIAIAFTKSQSGIGATLVVLSIFTISLAFQKKQPALIYLFLTTLVAVIFLKGDSVKRTLHSLNKTNPFYSDSLTIITEENKTRIGGSDSMTIRRLVWQGAIELGKKYPFFGTGAETFGYTYYWVRPAAHNLTSESDFLYNKAHNEFLNLLANTGFVGLLTYLYLIGAIFYLYTKSKDADHHHLRRPFILSLISILITNYFGFSVVNIGLFFFLFPAIFLADTNLSQPINRKFSFFPHLGMAISIFAGIYLLITVHRLWSADLAYTAGRSNINHNLKAVKLNPKEPIYYAQLGNLQALVASQVIAPQILEMTATTPAELRQKANYYLNQFVTDSLANTSKAVSMNKHNVNLFKTKARTELSLGSIDAQYNAMAIQTLLKITTLSPTDAANYFNIGLLYSQLNKTEEAKLAFQKAIELKSDFQAAKDQLAKLR